MSVVVLVPAPGPAVNLGVVVMSLDYLLSSEQHSQLKGCSGDVQGVSSSPGPRCCTATSTLLVLSSAILLHASSTDGPSLCTTKA